LKEFLGLFKIYAKKFDTILTTFDELPKTDLIAHTFEKLIYSLDNEISNLNKACMNNMEKLNINVINLKELSEQSDQLVLEIMKPTPESSPTITPSASTNNLNQ
jgi:hypothetical protein